MSPCSMTGYARIQGHDAQLGWVWEIKTVNARGLEIRSRFPSGFDGLDIPVRDAVQKRLTRGSVTISLGVTPVIGKPAFAVNEALLAYYAEVAARTASASGLASVAIDGLMGLKGVIEAAETGEPVVADEAHLRPALMDSFTEALTAVLAMRRDEGARLAVVLQGQLDEIESLVAQAEGCAALDPAAIKDRLRQQVAALIEAAPTLSDERLLQEAALIAAKADVREELDRLKAHLAAAREMISSTQAIGRRLDFLCQEFNREANTLCSKAGAVDLSRIGMALKAVIEQFREQVQNIE